MHASSEVSSRGVGKQNTPSLLTIWPKADRVAPLRTEPSQSTATILAPSHYGRPEFSLDHSTFLVGC